MIAKRIHEIRVAGIKTSNQFCIFQRVVNMLFDFTTNNMFNYEGQKELAERQAARLSI